MTGEAIELRGVTKTFPGAPGPAVAPLDLTLGAGEITVLTMGPAKAADMSAMDLVRYKARDGLEIPAFLTLPRSAEVKKNLPLIVYVHGGPWARTSWGLSPTSRAARSATHWALSTCSRPPARS